MNIAQAQGEVLREIRHERGLALRNIQERSYIALGYLSEVERGHKQASSEFLASWCQALDIKTSDLLWLTASKLQENGE